MTYTPRAWNTGDVITADELNTVEAGVAAAYDRSNHSGTQPANTVTGLAPVATSGAYADLLNAPPLAAVATSGDYRDLLGRPNLAGVAITGRYSDLLAAPSLATVASSGAYADLTGRPTLATVASTGNYADLANTPTLAAGSGVTLVTSGLTTTISAVSSGSSGGGSTNDADFGAVLLDSFQTGSLTDDQLLAAAMSAVGADTYPRTILLSNRLYSFATGNIQPYEGFRLHGAWGYSNPERNSGNKVAAPVSLNMNGAWFTAGTSTIYGVSLGNLALEGHGTNATFIGGSTGQFYCLMLRDISASGMRSILGTQANKLLITAAQFDGAWEINNSYSGAFHLGGSDNTLWPQGMLLDSGTAFNSSGSANGQYHLWCDGLDKSDIGPLYITAEGAWNGIRVSGAAMNSTGTNQSVLNFHGLRVEGRNPGAGCNGSLIRVEGGRVKIRDSWVSYGMISPSTPGHSPADAGIIHHSGGSLLVDGCTYDRATGVAETVPFVYTNSDGDCIVRSQAMASRGGTWSGRPRVALSSASTENRITDATVTQITV